MKQTGQPLIDGGRAIAAVLAGKTSIEQVETVELNSALEFLLINLGTDFHHPKALNNLKVLSSFWQNNALVQSNLGSAIPFYKTLISLLRDNVPIRSDHCQICGTKGSYINSNRTWLPLGGADGDPCSLPNLRGKFLCADCFRCVVLLPLGCRFCKAGPYIFHLTDPELQVEAMKHGVQTIHNAIIAKLKGTEGIKEDTKLSGRLELLEIVSGNRLWDSSRGGKLSKRAENGATIIAFSNDGLKPKWIELHLPAQALDFFLEITVGGVYDTFISLAAACDPPKIKVKGKKEKVPNEIFQLLCDDIEQRRSLGFLMTRIVRRRAEQTITKEELKVLEIYESTALGKGDRFETLRRIASRVNKMEDFYRDRFLKQLANARDIETFLDLLKKYAKSEKTKDQMRLTQDEYQVLYNSSPTEITNLLYLLCVAEDAQ